MKEEEHRTAMEAIERWKENQRLQSDQDKESSKEELAGSFTEAIPEDKEDNLSERTINDDTSFNERQNTSQTSAVQKQTFNNKQRINGKLQNESYNTNTFFLQLLYYSTSHFVGTVEHLIN